MLIRVLKNIIEPDELKQFIENFEESIGEKHYTKAKKYLWEFIHKY